MPSTVITHSTVVCRSYVRTIDFVLTGDDLARTPEVDSGQRLCPDPRAIELR